MSELGEAASGTETNTAEQSSEAQPSTLLGGVPATPEGESVDSQAKETPEGTQTEADAAKAEPETAYEFKLPEGVELDQEALGFFKPVAEDLKLPGESAQKLVDAYTKLRQAEADKHAGEWRTTQEQWVGEIKSDPTFGGANLDQNVQAAVAMVQKFGDDELRAYFDKTGLGNYPPLIRMMMRVGRAAAEDTIHRGGAAVSPRAPEELLYPTMSKQQ